MKPDHGAKVELKLLESRGTAAHYAISIFSPDSERTAAAFVDTDTDEVVVAEFRGGDPPAWLATFAHALLRNTLRVKSSGGDWPRRVTRWRPEPARE